LIFPRIRLTKTKHLPVLYLPTVRKKILMPRAALSVMWKSRGMSIKAHGDCFVLKHQGTSLKLLPEKATMFIKEYRNWEREYVPPFYLKGKTVLDVGSGCGETAYLWFRNGAAKVICVDLSDIDMAILKENAKRLNWNVEVHCEPFSEKHLTLPFDFAKIDCEGGEAELLRLERIDFPCALEAHSPELVAAFLEKGLRVLSENSEGGAFVMSNFHRLGHRLKIEVELKACPVFEQDPKALGTTCSECRRLIYARMHYHVGGTRCICKRCASTIDPSVPRPKMMRLSRHSDI